MKHLAIAFIALALGACASAAKPGAMVAELTEDTIISDASPLRESVSVGEVAGGKETSPLWKSNVSSEDFAEALRQSLAAHAMLSTDEGTYRLDAELVELKQPLVAFNSTVTSTINYTLTDLASGETVFEETVEEAYTAKMGDALVGVKRLQLANEGSIKQNIATLISLLIERVGNDASAPPAEEEPEAPADNMAEDVSS